MKIRVRIWLTKEKKMIYPDAERGDGLLNADFAIRQDGELMAYFHSESGERWWYFDLDAAIPMPSTGMNDGNGDEIWEGDIVGYNNHMSNMYHQNAVEFQNGRFVPITDKNEFGEPEWMKFRVLGNIYENPELMEEWRNENATMGRK